MTRQTIDPLLVSGFLAFSAYMDGLLAMPDLPMLAYWLIEKSLTLL